MDQKLMQQLRQAVMERRSAQNCSCENDCGCDEREANLDYAIALFADALQKEPAFYECREALRAAQLRRGGTAGSGGSGLFKRWLNQASPTLAKAQLAVRSNPAEAMAAAEQVLNDDP